MSSTDCPRPVLGSCTCERSSRCFFASLWRAFSVPLAVGQGNAERAARSAATQERRVLVRFSARGLSSAFLLLLLLCLPNAFLGSVRCSAPSP